MKDTTAIDIRIHAVQEYPRESCGLVAVINGREMYLPCRNQADSPDAHFVLHPEDWAKAEDLGEILAIVHSHPNEPARPSDADLVMIESTELPWHIVHVSIPDPVDMPRKNDGTLQDRGTVPVATDINTFEPIGYEAPLVGRTFSHGVLDCYTLIRDYFNRVHDIVLPEFERKDEWWNHGENLYMDHFRDAGFEPITGPIQVGDVVLMQIRSPTPNHGAVYIGDGMILQHLAKRLSSRDLYDGYFQENTRLIVRHRELNK
jgi:proteasome lid subunit RPN8/RPN11